MFYTIKRFFSWREIGRRGIWLYEENAFTKERRAVRCLMGGYSPKDIAWLDRRKKVLAPPN